jgi:hypothetical protein
VGSHLARVIGEAWQGRRDVVEEFRQAVTSLCS